MLAGGCKHRPRTSGCYCFAQSDLAPQGSRTCAWWHDSKGWDGEGCSESWRSTNETGERQTIGLAKGITVEKEREREIETTLCVTIMGNKWRQIARATYYLQKLLLSKVNELLASPSPRVVGRDASDSNSLNLSVRSASNRCEVYRVEINKRIWKINEGVLHGDQHHISGGCHGRTRKLGYINLITQIQNPLLSGVWQSDR